MTEAAPTPQRGRVLAIGPLHADGADGLLAAVKTVTALGGYALTVATSMAADEAAHAIPATVVAEHIRSTLNDPGVDALVLGRLADTATVEAVADILDAEARNKPTVVDPGLGGDEDAGFLGAFKARILLRATLVTPSIAEVETLTGAAVRSIDTLKDAAQMLLTLGCRAALVKGTALGGEDVADALASGEMLSLFTNPRVTVGPLRGAGIGLAAAAATGLAQDMSVTAAVRRARDFVRMGIRTSPDFGGRYRTINHVNAARDDWAPPPVAAALPL